MEPGDTAKATNGDSKFVWQVRQPNEVKTKRMFGILTAKGVEVVMSNYYYTVGGTIRRQEEGGVIGVRYDGWGHLKLHDIVGY